MTYMAAQALLLARIKTLPQFQDAYAASTMAFDTATHKITDSAGALAWIVVSDVITVTGSTLNDGNYTVSSSAAGFVVVNEDLVDELAGDPVTITRTPNATETDYRILNSGVTNMCVLLPGSVPLIDTLGMTRADHWEGIADLLMRFTDDASYSAFGTLRDAIISNLKAAPCLSEIYWVESIRAEGLPEEIPDKMGGGPLYLAQQLRIGIQEQV